MLLFVLFLCIFGAFLTVFERRMGVFPLNPDGIKDFRVHLMIDLLEQYGWKRIMLTRYYHKSGGLRISPSRRFLSPLSVSTGHVSLCIDIPNHSTEIIVIVTFYIDQNYREHKINIDLHNPNSIQEIEEIFSNLYPKLWWVELKWRDFKRWWKNWRG